MTTMLERVGHAVMHEALGDRRGYRQTWDMIDDDVRAEIIQAVGRAAIEAMRDPPARIINAVEMKAEERYRAAPEMQRWYGDDVWNAGIDAALCEGPHGAG